MLRFESIYWATKDKQSLTARLEELGFSVTESRRDPGAKAVFFGPEAIEIFSSSEDLETLKVSNEGLARLQSVGGGIFGLGLETDFIGRDYKKLKAQDSSLEPPRKSTSETLETPDWFGFNVPTPLTPALPAWVVMNSNAVLEKRSQEVLPISHPNTCFGIEGVHLLSTNPEALMKKWGELLEKSVSGLHWNEFSRAQAFRLQSNLRFLDAVQMEKNSLLTKTAKEREGVFMLTLNVTDLEKAKYLCKKAGSLTIPCQSRDGFIVPPETLGDGSPCLRFTRAFWRRYVPEISQNFPEGRKKDEVRPLGGTFTTTLEKGFQDDWSY